MDEETEQLTGTLAEYVSYAKECLGNQTLEFVLREYDNYDELIQALQDREIDVIFLCRQKSVSRRRERICTNEYSLDLQPDGGNG